MQNSNTIVILSSSRVKWYAYFLFGKGQSQGWSQGQGHATSPQVMDWTRWSSCIYIDSGAQCHVITMVPFSTLYFNLTGSYLRKTLMTQKNPLWRQSSQSKLQNKAGRHNGSVWQQYWMCASSDYIILCYKMGHFSITPFSYNGRGHVTDLTSGNVY